MKTDTFDAIKELCLKNSRILSFMLRLIDNSFEAGEIIDGQSVRGLQEFMRDVAIDLKTVETIQPDTPLEEIRALFPKVEIPERENIINVIDKFNRIILFGDQTPTAIRLKVIDGGAT